jgi:hypothetical protein
MPKKVPEWLNDDIQESYPTCQGNIRAIQRAILEKRGVEIAYMTITERMKKLGLERPRDKSKKATVDESTPQGTSMSSDTTPVEVLPGQISRDAPDTGARPSEVVNGLSAIADIVPVTIEPLDHLSPDELQTLEHYEQIIAQGIQTFVQVGQALLAIRELKLYRADYPTFEEYCRKRWDLSRPYAYQLMEASVVVENVSAIADIIPANEAQARPLTRLESVQQQEVWKEAVETAPPTGVTAKHVQQIVKRVKERTTRPTPPVPAPQPRRQARIKVQDGLVGLLKIIPDREAWPILGEFALLLDRYVEPRAETPAGQDMGKQLASLWTIIQQHELD